jgi:phosphodiesterase/alkaline phosphatase D-like protein
MPTTKIAFTSCARYKPGQPQTAWQDILEANPDYLFLLGDQIYMDFGLWPFSCEYQGKPKSYSVAKFAAVMRQKYERQWSEPNFAKLVAHMRAKNGFFGVFDDHDFGWNNAYGKDATLSADVHLAEKREIARNLFHEFMACATQAPDIFGCIDTPYARVIFLDNRSEATPLSVANPVLMGEKQMDFLRDQMQHKRHYTLICGGLTLTQSAENWSRYSNEFDQFKQLVASASGRVLFLGGDIHKNAFFAPDDLASRPCYEIISSGVCVNYLGLPFEFDQRRNWTLLEINPAAVRVSQHDKNGVTRYRIDTATWQHQLLGRELRSDKVGR